MTELIGRLWTFRKHHEWWCLSNLNCTGQDTLLKDRITWRICAVQFPSRVWPFATPRTSAPQDSLTFTICQSSPKLISVESMTPSNHFILCHPLLLLPSIFPSIRVFSRVFSNESTFCIRWPKYWSFRFSISPSHEYSGLICFRMDWWDLLAV